VPPAQPVRPVRLARRVRRARLARLVRRVRLARRVRTVRRVRLARLARRGRLARLVPRVRRVRLARLARKDRRARPARMVRRVRLARPAPWTPLARTALQALGVALLASGDGRVDVDLDEGQAPLGVEGADACRLYEMFIGPPEEDVEWTEAGLNGVGKFLQRVWRLVMEPESIVEEAGGNATAVDATVLRRKVAQTVGKVTEHFDELRFNTAVAFLMELTNAMQDYLVGGGARDAEWDGSVRTLLKLLNPLAPHVCEEMWQRLGEREMLADASWPAFDSAAAREPSVTLVVTVAGKLRDRVVVDAGLSEAQALDAFRDLISRADHVARMDDRFSAQDIEGGMRAARRLGEQAVPCGRHHLRPSKQIVPDEGDAMGAEAGGRFGCLHPGLLDRPERPNGE